MPGACGGGGVFALAFLLFRAGPGDQPGGCGRPPPETGAARENGRQIRPGLRACYGEYAAGYNALRHIFPPILPPLHLPARAPAIGRREPVHRGLLSTIRPRLSPAYPHLAPLRPLIEAAGWDRGAGRTAAARCSRGPRWALGEARKTGPGALADTQPFARTRERVRARNPTGSVRAVSRRPARAVNQGGGAAGSGGGGRRAGVGERSRAIA